MTIERGWRAVVMAADCTPCECCGEPVCPRCQLHYSECDCPGPTQDDEYEYTIIQGQLYARPIYDATP